MIIAKANDVEQNKNYDFSFLKTYSKNILSKAEPLYLAKENTFISSQNTFIDSLYKSYSSHLPVRISPDVIYTIILQNFSFYINRNFEKFRKIFTTEKDKINIVVERNWDFNNKNNDWQGVISEFKNKTILNTNDIDLKDLFENCFSTSTNIDKVIFATTFLFATNKYYTHTLLTMCGIPYYEIDGTINDWISIKDKINILDKFDLSFWKEKLVYLIDNIILSYSEDNKEFWEKFFRNNNESGVDYINGYVQYLFPFLYKTKGKNDLPNIKNNFEDNIESGLVPVSYVKFPFVWNYLGKNFKLNATAGITSIDINDGVIIPTNNIIIEKVK